MADTKIDWATKSWNWGVGCAPCSPGCDRCWARTWVHRAASNSSFSGSYRKAEPWDGTLVEFPKRWKQPLHWRKPQRVFVGSQTDIALWPLDALAHALDVMADCPQHRFLVLTKRPGLLDDSMAEMDAGFGPNVWLGVTCCNQDELDRKLAELLAIPAVHYWVCLEPLLSGVVIPPEQLARLTLVIVGGESGPGARPCRPEWVRAIRDQCQAAGVPLWLKANPETIDGKQYKELPNGLRLRGEK